MKKIIQLQNNYPYNYPSNDIQWLNYEIQILYHFLFLLGYNNITIEWTRP